MTFHFGAQKKKKKPFSFPPLMWGLLGFFLSYLEKADLLMYRQTREQGLCSAVFLESM